MKKKFFEKKVLQIVTGFTALAVAFGITAYGGTDKIVSQATGTVAAAEASESFEAETDAGSLQSVHDAFYKNGVPSDHDAVKIGNKYAYDFRDSRNYGFTGYGYQTIDFEALAGIRLSVKGNTVTYSLYSHNRNIADTASVKVYTYGDYQNAIKSVIAKEDIDRTFSVKGFEDGLYRVEITLKVRQVEYPVVGYLYVEKGMAQTCRVSNNMMHTYNMDNWNYLMKDADPQDYLSNASVTYPTSGLNGNCVQTQKWEELSDTIILNDDWTDEAKVFALTKWLTDNTAYDCYRAVTSDMASRAKQAGDYKSDKYWMYGNHVGICWDYTNALTIMCRHQGIPATSAESFGHTICAVWLNGGWVGVDVTQTVTHTCHTKDTDSAKWTDSGSNWSGYGRYDGSMFHHDGEIWTQSIGSGKTYWSD